MDVVSFFLYYAKMVKNALSKKRLKHFTLTSLFWSVGYGTSFLVLLIESYKSANSIQRYLGVNSAVIAILFLLAVLSARTRGIQVPAFLAQLNAKFIFPVSVAVTIGLTLLEQVTYENYVFSLTSFHYHKLSLISVFSLAFGLFSLKINWKTPRAHFILFTIPLLLVSYFLLADSWPFNYFIEMSKEDRIIEWSQFVIIAISAIYSALAAWQLRRKHIIYAGIYAVITLALIAIAGDEISWGQRLIGLATPEQLAARNVQGEITFHNMDLISTVMWQAYFVVGLFGTFGWLLKSDLVRLFPFLQKSLDLLVPPWYTSLYFFVLLNYQIRTRPGVTHSLGYWGESIELLLYLGTAIFIWQVYAQQKSTR